MDPAPECGGGGGGGGGGWRLYSFLEEDRLIMNLIPYLPSLFYVEAPREGICDAANSRAQATGQEVPTGLFDPG